MRGRNKAKGGLWDPTPTSGSWAVTGCAPLPRAGGPGDGGGGTQGAVLGRWGWGWAAEGKGMSKGKGHGIGQGIGQGQASPPTLPGRAGQLGVHCALGAWAWAWALGTKGGLSREGQEKVEVHLRLAPGRIRGSGRPPPGWSPPPP